MSVSRIGDRRAGHASWSRQYAIGYHSCSVCKVETPDPPQSVFDELAQKHSTISTIWPFGEGGWNPPGWLQIDTIGEICDRCARDVAACLAGRKRQAPFEPTIDLTIAEGNIARALQLATDGLDAAFPPPPIFVTEARTGRPLAIGRHQSPRRNVSFDTHNDYQLSELREQIRLIRDALLGVEGLRASEGHVAKE